MDGRRPRSSQPNWNVQAALGSIRAANGDLWIVASSAKYASPNGILALNGARGLTANTPVMPPLVSALAAGKIQPQTSADPFAPDGASLFADPSATLIDALTGVAGVGRSVGAACGHPRPALRSPRCRAFPCGAAAPWAVAKPSRQS